MSERYGFYSPIPPAIDIHVHDREPSPINRGSNFYSGSRGGLAGGYGARVDMPNTPGHETWTYERAMEKIRLIGQKAVTYTGIYAGSQENSDNHNELERMAEVAMGLKFYIGPTTGTEGQIDFNLDYYWETARLWHEHTDKPILVHLGDVHPQEVIDEIALKTGHRLHFCHVNDPAQADIVHHAKREGLPVTCGITPHHLFMDSHDTHTLGWFARMQPPLAAQADSEKLWWQLFDENSIDLIETDHAPHMIGDKWRAEIENPLADSQGTVCYGVPGSRYTMPQLLNQERRGRVTLKKIVEKTVDGPAELLGIRVNPDSQVVWSKRLYRIGEEPAFDGSPAMMREVAATPYLGNFAVGEVESFRLSGRQLIAGGRITSEKLESGVLRKGQEI